MTLFFVRCLASEVAQPAGHDSLGLIVSFAVRRGDPIALTLFPQGLSGQSQNLRGGRAAPVDSLQHRQDIVFLKSLSSRGQRGQGARLLSILAAQPFVTEPAGLLRTSSSIGAGLKSTEVVRLNRRLVSAQGDGPLHEILQLSYVPWIRIPQQQLPCRLGKSPQLFIEFQRTGFQYMLAITMMSSCRCRSGGTKIGTTLSR